MDGGAGFTGEASHSNMGKETLSKLQIASQAPMQGHAHSVLFPLHLYINVAVWNVKTAIE